MSVDDFKDMDVRERAPSISRRPLIAAAALIGGAGYWLGGFPWRPRSSGGIGSPSVELPPMRRPGGDHSDTYGPEWLIWKDRFYSDDGRVIDTGNHGVSHSEGQSYGLLFSEAADDRGTFDRILGWTLANLSRPGDSLEAWRFDPRSSPPVADMNSATDGDLITAWALARAAARWGETSYLEQAQRMADDILGLAVAKTHGGPVLLPGADGFDHFSGCTLNLSYYSFLAMSDLNRIVPDIMWQGLSEHGLALIRQSQFGRWRLPPDWLWVSKFNGLPRPDPDHPPRFSYDAVRIPLHLIWAGHGADPAVANAVEFWRDSQGAAWVDLDTNQLGDDNMTPGHVAIAAIAVTPGPAVPLPSVAAAQDYYGGSLVMLARLAALERPS